MGPVPRRTGPAQTGRPTCKIDNLEQIMLFIHVSVICPYACHTAGHLKLVPFFNVLCHIRHKTNILWMGITQAPSHHRSVYHHFIKKQRRPNKFGHSRLRAQVKTIGFPFISDNCRLGRALKNIAWKLHFMNRKTSHLEERWTLLTPGLFAWPTWPWPKICISAWRINSSFQTVYGTDLPSWICLDKFHAIRKDRPGGFHCTLSTVSRKLAASVCTKSTG